MKKSIMKQVMCRAHEIRKNFVLKINDVEVNAQSYAEAMRYCLKIAWAEYRSEDTDITRGLIVDKRNIKDTATKKVYNYNTLAVNDYGKKGEIIQVLNEYEINPEVVIDWLHENGLEAYFVNTDGRDLCAVDEDSLEVRVSLINGKLTVNGEW